MNLLTITDEKLQDYLSVWDGLIPTFYKSKLDIEITLDFMPPLREPLYTLKYGEEIRKITFEQAVEVRNWFYRLRRDERDHAS